MRGSEKAGAWVFNPALRPGGDTPEFVSYDITAFHPLASTEKCVLVKIILRGRKILGWEAKTTVKILT